MSKHMLKVFGPLVATLFLLLAIAYASAAGDVHVQHPARDMGIHQDFYMKWDRPDFPGNNCCKLTDCFPTAIRNINGQDFALTRTLIVDANGSKTGEYYLNDPKEPRNWTLIPPERLEQNQIPGHKTVSPVTSEEYTMREPIESPDGRTHVCMLDNAPVESSAASAKPVANSHVLCAVKGGAI